MQNKGDCFDPFWLPQFHKQSIVPWHSLMFLKVCIVGMQSRQWNFNDAEDVGNWGNQFESQQPFLFYSMAALAVWCVSANYGKILSE